MKAWNGAALLVAALVGCGTDPAEVSGTRVGTQDQEVSTGPLVGRVVVVTRSEASLAFEGEPDAVLSVDTLAQPDSLRVAGHALPVVLVMLKPDSGSGAWLTDPGLSIPRELLPIRKVCLTLTDSASQGTEVALPGTGIASIGVEVGPYARKYCFAAPQLSWPVVLRTISGADTAMRSIALVSLSKDIGLDVTRLICAPKGCRTALDTLGQFVRRADGTLRCLE